MTLKRLGRPPFLAVAEVENDDVVEVVDAPYIVEAEKTRWGRERARVVVKLDNGEERTWSLNNTTYNRLLDAFGNEGRNSMKPLKTYKPPQLCRDCVHKTTVCTGSLIYYVCQKGEGWKTYCDECSLKKNLKIRTKEV